jgi:hypothetical protein
MNRRLLWIWALISVGWAIYAIYIIAQNWSREPTGDKPLYWGLEHRKCLDRFAFWPDDTRMDDDDLKISASDLLSNRISVK